MITIKLTENERLRLLFELQSAREICEESPDDFSDDLDEIKLLMAKLQDSDQGTNN